MITLFRTLLAAALLIPAATWAKDAPKEKVRVEMYTMSLCPYSPDVQKDFATVVKKLDGYLDFSMEYVGRTNNDGTIKTTHGQPEIDGNIVQLCAQKYEPRKFYAMINEMNKNIDQIPGNWEKAAKKAGVNVAAVKACVTSGEGKALHQESVLRSMGRGITTTPTIRINGAIYDGERDYKSMLKAVCYTFTNDWPSACKGFARPKRLNAWILNDKRCTEGCYMDTIKYNLKKDLPGVRITEVDYSSPEGQKLYKEAGIRFLPFIVFDDTAKKGTGNTNVDQWLKPAGKYFELKLNSTFDPSREVCDNGIDDDKNGKADCADPFCKAATVCRQEEPKSLDLFIGGADKFASTAVSSLREIVYLLGKNVNFSVHYLMAVKSNGQLDPSIPDNEVSEAAMGKCVQKYAQAQFLPYLSCRAKNDFQGAFDSCMSNAEVNQPKVLACYNGTEGRNMLLEDAYLVEKLRISASPTWLANNRHLFLGLDTETVLTNYFKYNKGIKVDEKAASGAGKQAWNFTLKDLKGTRLSLATFRGKKVLVTFWSSKCEPCREELPMFQKLHDENPDLVVLMVNYGERPAWVKAFIEKEKHTFPVLLDEDMVAGNKYNVKMTPTTFFINKDGTIFFKKESLTIMAEMKAIIKDMK